MRSYFER
jgi:predicted DsbA family dithiol-disulfide isomerase